MLFHNREEGGGTSPMMMMEKLMMRKATAAAVNACMEELEPLRMGSGRAREEHGA